MWKKCGEQIRCIWMYQYYKQKFDKRFLLNCTSIYSCSTSAVWHHTQSGSHSGFISADHEGKQARELQTHQEQPFVLQSHVMQSRRFSWQVPGLQSLHKALSCSLFWQHLQGVRTANQVAKVRKCWKVHVCFLQGTLCGSQRPTQVTTVEWTNKSTQSDPKSLIQVINSRAQFFRVLLLRILQDVKQQLRTQTSPFNVTSRLISKEFSSTDKE